MFQRMKKSWARNKVNTDKMTVVTKAAVWTIFASLMLWAPFYYWDLLNWFRGEFDYSPVWIPYIMLYFAIVVHIQRGRGNLAFVVALASAPVQLALGFYQYWDTIFTLDPYLALEDVQWSFENFGLWLYLSNILHLVGLVLLIAGRKEWRKRKTLIEQARLQKEEEVRIRERQELLELRKRKLLVTLKKPWVLGISLLVTLSLIASGVIFFVSNPSWSTLVKSCDSLMSQESLRKDSYTLNNSQDELWLITLDSPTSSKWVDCIGWNLAEGSSTKSLTETLSSLSFDGENFAYGNLDIFTIKQGIYYKIRISKID